MVDDEGVEHAVMYIWKDMHPSLREKYPNGNLLIVFEHAHFSNQYEAYFGEFNEKYADLDLDSSDQNTQRKVQRDPDEEDEEFDDDDEDDEDNDVRLRLNAEIWKHVLDKLKQDEEDILIDLDVESNYTTADRDEL